MRQTIRCFALNNTLSEAKEYVVFFMSSRSAITGVHIAFYIDRKESRCCSLRDYTCLLILVSLEVIRSLPVVFSQA